MPFALDLDGVIWLGDEPIPGAAAAVAQLRAAGEDVVFCTNASTHPVAVVEEKLARHGVPARGDVITSAMAAASLIEPGERVLVCGGPGVVEAIEGRGAEPVRSGPADAVIVGFHWDFDYERLRAASTAVRDGARLLATNSDVTYPTPDGPIPGGGAILAAVVAATGATPVIAGKPHDSMAELIRSRLGYDAMVIGDRADTDGLMARILGYRFGLVLSGITTDAGGADPAPDLVAADLASLVEELLVRG